MKIIGKIKTMLICITILSFMNASCGDDGNGGDNPEPERTLTKTQLYDKVWVEPTKTVVHKIKSTGDYGTSGSWKWLNDSDSMQIIQYQSAPKTIWYFDWSTETLMQCRHGKSGTPVVYTIRK